MKSFYRHGTKELFYVLTYLKLYKTKIFSYLAPISPVARGIKRGYIVTGDITVCFTKPGKGDKDYSTLI